jgi:hypothetical protein
MDQLRNLKSFILIIFLVFFAFLTSCAQHEEHKDQQKEEQEKQQTNSSMIREGEINLKAIDENGDGMVFQDPMDWNVISDEAGTCPLCKMELKEVTLEEAKENLIKNNFKVKNN